MKHDLGLPESVVGWIKNYSRKNYWRVARTGMDLDDLIQDGLVCAYKCRERYGDDLDIPHFMRLVQITFSNHITDIIRQQFKSSEVKISDVVKNRLGEEPIANEADAIDRIAEPTPPPQELSILIAELPVHLRNAVELLISDPVQFRKQFRQRLNGASDTLSKRLAGLIGWPENLDFEIELRSYMWERQHGFLKWENSTVKSRIHELKLKREEE